jgi:sulfur-oxidizing protein SoxX
MAAVAQAMPGGSAHAADAAPPSALEIVGDGIPEPVAATPGDPARGRSLMLARDPANCILCHAIPDPAVRFSGDLGPPLAASEPAHGSTASASRRRHHPLESGDDHAKLLSGRRLSSCRSAYRGKPILTAAEVEDVVAYLATHQMR